MISQVCGLRPRVDFISGVATPPGCLDQRKVFPGVAGASDRDCRLLDGADRQHGGSPAIVGEGQLRHRASQDGDSESQVSRESCCCIFFQSSIQFMAYHIFVFKVELVTLLEQFHLTERIIKKPQGHLSLKVCNDEFFRR